MIDRRSMIGAGLALGAAPALAKDPKIAFEVPDGACDSHLHIYDSRFAYMPNAVLKPPLATVADYRALQKKLGTSRCVVVQPSTYGTDILDEVVNVLTNDYKYTTKSGTPGMVPGTTPLTFGDKVRVETPEVLEFRGPF